MTGRSVAGGSAGEGETVQLARTEVGDEEVAAAGEVAADLEQAVALLLRGPA